VPLVVAVAILAGCGADSADAPPDCEATGWTTLFDGTAASLGEWRMAGPGRFELLDDGTLATRGGLGLLWHPDELGEHELSVEWSVAGDDNSGVFVGFPDPGDDPMVAVEQGYEVQVDATDAPDRTTGSLYGVAAPDTAARDAALLPPGEWNTFVVVVRQDRVQVRLNGTLVTDHAVGAGPTPAGPGHVGLQNHGEGDDVRFREVRVRPLAPGGGTGCASPDR